MPEELTVARLAAFVDQVTFPALLLLPTVFVGTGRSQLQRLGDRYRRGGRRYDDCLQSRIHEKPVAAYCDWNEQEKYERSKDPEIT
jgi:hypothetical protein